MQETSSYSAQTSQAKEVQVKHFGLVDYTDSFVAMRDYAAQRDDSSADQIWLLQHPPVYTQGTACSMTTLLPSNIPVVKTDRGGQITYHGPGQLVMYPLIDLRRHNLGVKSLVAKLEQSVIDLLEAYQLRAARRADAPGVYVEQAKIASLGLRIRRGNSYHGLSLNVDMDLHPFGNIDPCGFQNMAVTSLSQLDESFEASIDSVADDLAARFLRLL